MKSNVINEGRHMPRIIDETVCGHHDAQKGVACFAVPASKRSSGVDGILLGICNRRAIKAGANGKISESSYQSSKRVLKNHRPKA